MSLNSQKASFLSRSSQNNFFLIYFSQKKKKDRKISIFDKNRGLTPLKQYSLKKILFFLEFNQTSFFFIYFASKQKIEKSQYSDKTASASRVTGDEEQGTMESVKKGGEVPSRSCAVFLARRYF